MRVLLFVVALICMNLVNADYKLETVAKGLNFPWSIAFLPGGDYLVAMRSGEVRQISSSGDVAEPLKGLPQSYVAGQGGYFDIILDPDFSSNQVVYLSLAHGSPTSNATRIVKGRLDDGEVKELETIFTVAPKKDTTAHFGGKMQFLADGTLMLTTGDGFEYRDAAQDRFSQLGKILRMNSDGSVPADNPYADGVDGNPYVFSYGHRNPQGLALDESTGTIYMHEHGPRGGDELNSVIAGKNYGWPAVIKGINYSGAYVSPLRSAPGVNEPLTYWEPSIAPSGLAIYQGAAFPDWQGDLFVGALVDQEVRRLEMDSGKVISETPLFSEVGERIRDVRLGPDGYLYLLTDSPEGSVIRVTPQ
jgi:glucose/arabinose dehydrogenase